MNRNTKEMPFFLQHITRRMVVGEDFCKPAGHTTAAGGKRSEPSFSPSHLQHRLYAFALGMGMMNILEPCFSRHLGVWKVRRFETILGRKTAHTTQPMPFEAGFMNFPPHASCAKNRIGMQLSCCRLVVKRTLVKWAGVCGELWGGALDTLLTLVFDW